jgi:hypothetical protein
MPAAQAIIGHHLLKAGLQKKFALRFVQLAEKAVHGL